MQQQFENPMKLPNLAMGFCENMTGYGLPTYNARGMFRADSGKILEF
jgi:hypothetical protein